MLKGQNKLSVKDEITKVKKWDFKFPTHGKFKIFINNWINPFLLIVKISTIEQIESVTVSASWTNKTILSKIQLICNDLKFYGANNVLLANRSRGEWIKENIDTQLTDIHSKIALVKTKDNFYVIFGSENYGNECPNELEHLTFTNNKTLYNQIKSHLAKIKK